MLFGAASSILFGFLYWQTNNYYSRRVEEWLMSEQASFSPMDQSASLMRLAAHVIADPALERPFTLFDAEGNELAGSHLDLPASFWSGLTLDQPFDFSLGAGRKPTPYLGLAHRLPSGE